MLVRARVGEHCGELACTERTEIKQDAVLSMINVNVNEGAAKKIREIQCVLKYFHSTKQYLDPK